MAEGIVFDVHDSISQEYVATLDLDDWAFNDPLGGPGSLNASIAVKDSNYASQLRLITEPWRYSIYASLEDSYLWGGPITSRPWQRNSGTLQLNAMQWEGWLYTRLLQTKFVRKNIDQFKIVQTLVSIAIAENGCPRITIPIAATSALRDLTVDPWVSIGEAIDRLAARDPGFDWAIEIRKNKSTGNPEPYLSLWYPERKSAKDPEVIFESIISEEDEGSENSIHVELDDWPDDSEGRVSRMWATGDGQPPDQPSSNDEDPALDENLTLLTEAVTNWSGVTKRTTLQEHAAQERKYRGASIQTVTLNVSAVKPDLRNYMTGDRCRLVARDRWIDVDYPGVKIIDRVVRGSKSEGLSASVVIDLNDFEAPDESEGVDA